MLRPKSIAQFEQCYLGSMVLGFIILALSWGARSAAMQANPAVAAMGGGFLAVSALLGLAISLALWYFAARKGSVVAKWIIVVFFGLSAIGFLFSLGSGALGIGGPIVAVLTVANFVLHAVATYLLFPPDSRAWFGETGTTPAL